MPGDGFPGALVAAHLGRVDEARTRAHLDLAAGRAMVSALPLQGRSGFSVPRAFSRRFAAAHALLALALAIRSRSMLEPVNGRAGRCGRGLGPRRRARRGRRSRARRIGLSARPFVGARGRCAVSRAAAAGRGKWTEPIGDFERALAQHGDGGSVPARPHAACSRCTRRRAKRRAAARATLVAALAIFERLGRRLGREARAELGGIGGRTPRAAPDGGRAPCRRARRGRPDEPRGRGRAVPRRADRGEPPDAHLREARRALAHRARASAARAKFRRSDVSTATRAVVASSACRATSSRPTSLAAKRESATPVSGGPARLRRS